MNQIRTLAIVTLASLSFAASAQMGHTVSKSAKHTIACPVTGDRVDMEMATKTHMYADYKGSRYFFCCADCPAAFKKNPAKFASKPHAQLATITVDGAFSPAIVQTKAGQPVVLIFDTKKRACATAVIIDGTNLSEPLKDGAKSMIIFTPKKGKTAFHCPMNMIKGTIVAK